MDAEQWIRVYKLTYGAVATRIGPEMTITFTAMSEDDVNTSDPVRSVKEFLVPVRALFGDTTTHRAMHEALIVEFEASDVETIMKELGIGQDSTFK